MRRGADGWARVRATFGTPARPRGGPGGERLWLGPAGWSDVQLWLPRRPARVVICPKTAPVGWWLAAGGVPSDIGFACTSHPNDAGALRVLEQALPRTVPAVFVGDLDPLAIVQYLELARSFGRRKRPLLYGGVDDAWLAAMRGHWVRTNGVDAVRIPLDDDEGRLLAKLDRAIDLERLVGPESSALLRAGHKIELEGATNPVLYGDGFARWAFRHLRRVTGNSA